MSDRPDLHTPFVLPHEQNLVRGSNLKNCYSVSNTIGIPSQYGAMEAFFQLFLVSMKTGEISPLF